MGAKIKVLLLYPFVNKQYQWLFAGLLGLEVSFFIEMMKKSVGNFMDFDIQFFTNMIVLVVIDTILGVLVSIKAKKLSSEGYSMVFIKLIVYSLLLLATHAASRYKLHGSPSLLSWVDSFVYASIAAREFLSILENAASLVTIGGLDKLKPMLEKIINMTGLDDAKINKYTDNTDKKAEDQTK